MWQLFGLEIGRFSILVLSALVVFGLFWLYFDAWRERKNSRDIPLLIGLVLLSLSFLMQGTTLETGILATTWKGSWLDLSRNWYLYMRLIAYAFMMVGLFLTPIQPRPALNVAVGLGMAGLSVHFMIPIFAAIVALLYWRRASVGLEAHLSRVAIGFSLLAVFELLGLAQLFRITQEVWLFRLVAPFGILQLVQYMILFVAMYILARWTWYYLLKRLSTQLFMLTLSGAVGLSLLVSGLFITLLLKNLEAESLQKLTSNAKVVASLMQEKKEHLLSETKLLSIDQTVLDAITTGDRKNVTPVMRSHMAQTRISSLAILDKDGKIVARGENEEERGTSLSEDKGVQKALKGENVSEFSVQSGVLSPEVRLRVIVPAGTGALIAEQVFDNAYVDGLKTTTGMSTSLYGDKILSATTEDIGDGKTRLVGVKEVNQEVLDTVWKNGKVMAIPTTLGEHAYLSGYVPLKDNSNITVAALQVAEPQLVALQTAGAAVQNTFALVIAIIVALSFPIQVICQRLVAEWE